MGIALAPCGLVAKALFEGFTKLSLWREKSNPICMEFSTDASQRAGGMEQVGPREFFTFN